MTGSTIAFALRADHEPGPGRHVLRACGRAMQALRVAKALWGGSETQMTLRGLGPVRLWSHRMEEEPSGGHGRVMRWWLHVEDAVKREVWWNSRGERIVEPPAGRKVAELRVETGSNDGSYRACHAYVELGGEDDVLVALAVPRLFSVYVGAELPRLPERVAALLPREDRKTGISVHSGKAWLSLAACEHGSISDSRLRDEDPAWLHRLASIFPLNNPRNNRRPFRPMGIYDEESPTFLRSGFEAAVHYRPADLIFGPRTYVRSAPIREHEGRVDLPEGTYPATATVEDMVYERPRLGRLSRTTRRSTTVEVPGGVPVPGKGESSWDCDDDAVYSQSSPARTPAEAFEALREAALSSRRRYASEGWVPDGGWPDHLEAPAVLR